MLLCDVRMFNNINISNNPVSRMEPREGCYYFLLFIMFASSGFLVYLLRTVEMNSHLCLRLLSFEFQHLFSLGMLLSRKIRNEDDSPISHLKWLLCFSGINFLSFCSVEIHNVIDEENNVPYELNMVKKFRVVIVGYYHLYFQFSIYIGIFFFFSFLMYVIYKCNEYRENGRLEGVMEGIQENKCEGSGNEDDCPICLGEIEKGQEIYSLNCHHSFHVVCMNDWLKEKLTCPMCRDDLTRYAGQGYDPSQYRDQQL